MFRVTRDEVKGIRNLMENHRLCTLFQHFGVFGFRKLGLFRRRPGLGRGEGCGACEGMLLKRKKGSVRGFVVRGAGF